MTRRSWLGGCGPVGAGSLALGGAAMLGAQQQTPLPRLIAHWPLDGDCRDAAGQHQGDGHNVTHVQGHDGRNEAQRSLTGSTRSSSQARRGVAPGR